MAIRVSDSASNRNEQIENAATAIGRSEHRRLVFCAIHHGKRRFKTVAVIAEMTGLTPKQVLNAGRQLHRKQVVDQTREDGQTAYWKDDFLQAHKSKVLSLADDKKRLEKYPTKRILEASRRP